MVNVSVLEFAVYAIVAYTSLIILFLTMLKNPPTGKKSSIARAIYMLAGVIFCFVIAGVGPTIELPSITTSDYTIAVNSSEHFDETITTTSSMTILNGPVWTYGHMMLGVLMLLYVLQEIATLLTARD